MQSHRNSKVSWKNTPQRCSSRSVCINSALTLFKPQAADTALVRHTTVFDSDSDSMILSSDIWQDLSFILHFPLLLLKPVFSPATCCFGSLCFPIYLLTWVFKPRPSFRLCTPRVWVLPLLVKFVEIYQIDCKVQLSTLLWIHGGYMFYSFYVEM